MTVATGESIAEVEARFDGEGYGAFKEDVGEALVGLLGPIQERYRELRSDPAELGRLLAVGADKAARGVARRRSTTMYERMGFVRPVADARSRSLAAWRSAATSSRVSSRHSPGASPSRPRPA